MADTIAITKENNPDIWELLQAPDNTEDNIRAQIAQDMNFTMVYGKAHIVVCNVCGRRYTEFGAMPYRAVNDRMVDHYIMHKQGRNNPE